ncbi:MAG: PadR family transcriptional regulator [Chloroflexota bacterium]
MLKYILLGFLRYRPMTGYALKEAISTSTSHFWHAELSQIYVTLKALEANGLVGSEVQAQKQRPDRRVYTITPHGESDLRQWLAEPQIELEKRKEPFLLKLFFSAALEKNDLLAHLYLQRRQHEQYYQFIHDKMAEQIWQSAQQYPHLAKDASLWEATRRLGELQQAAYLQWLDETIERVEKEWG